MLSKALGKRVQLVGFSSGAGRYSGDGGTIVRALLFLSYDSSLTVLLSNLSAMSLNVNVKINVESAQAESGTWPRYENTAANITAWVGATTTTAVHAMENCRKALAGGELVFLTHDSCCLGKKSRDYGLGNSARRKL